MKKWVSVFSRIGDGSDRMVFNDKEAITKPCWRKKPIKRQKRRGL
jgi:hypothetical protein